MREGVNASTSFAYQFLSYLALFEFCIFFPLAQANEESKRTAHRDAKKKDPVVDASFLPSSSLATKIAPASSSLVSLYVNKNVRTQRDPRLLKQPQEDPPSVEPTKPRGKPRDPRLDIESEKRSRSSDKDTEKRLKSSDKELDKRSRSSEKELSSKSTQRRSRDDSTDRSSNRHSDRREGRDKRTSDNRKSSRNPEDQVSRPKKTTSRSPSKSSPSKSSKNSSKRDRRGETARSPRKSSYTARRPVSEDSPDSDTSDTKDRIVSPRTSSASSEWPVSYTKGSYKGRNYVRKNQPEKSPEFSASGDVDLRVIGPPEKQLRLSNPSEMLLQSSSSSLSAGVPEQIVPTIACQDVDLRCLSLSPTKKRAAEPEDGSPPSKKNKAAYMEMLFGSQDVDLRRKDLVNGLLTEAPSPPPPPIISSPEGMSGRSGDGLSWSKFKQALTPSPTIERSPAFPRLSRHDRLGRGAGEGELSQNEDTDMRIPINGIESSSKTQQILATAAEQLRSGTMTRADFEQVQKQVCRMHESEKIREAQQNDFTRRSKWERGPQRERDYRHGRGSPDNEQFGDVDDRFPPARPGKKTLLPLPSIPPMPQAPHQHRQMGPRPRMTGYTRPRPSMMGMGPRGHGQMWRNPRMGYNFKENTISLPQADPFILKRIEQDSMKTITIDGFPRQIRFYGEDAVVLMKADDPREIAFNAGDASVIINDVLVHCSFHKPAQEVNIGGKMYSVRLGAPTRELYVNDEGFECQFNTPAKEIFLATGEVFRVQLRAEVPPMVHVGNQRRDLVAGSVLLIIDAEVEKAVTIYLDAKPQRFDIDEIPHIIKFADGLSTILVNNHPFNVEFGGPVVPITVDNRRHYMRLTALPEGVVPGEVEIVSMSRFRTKGPAAAAAMAAAMGAPWSGAAAALASQPQPQPADDDPALATALHEPALPVRGGLGALTRGVPKKIMKPKGRSQREPNDSHKAAPVEDRKMPADLFHAIQPGEHRSGSVGAGSVDPSSASAPDSVGNSSTSGSNGIPFLAPVPDLDVHKLVQSLYNSGILSSISSPNDTKKEKVKEDDKKKIHVVDFKESSTFKVKQPAIIDILYSGMQCSSCGTRFPPEQTDKYSSHLDWHFRQNRRDKDSVRKPQSRKWYYDVTDWIQFEEIDDTVEKTQNWFDTQQTETAKFEEPEEEEIQSVPSNDFPDGTICELCHERFDQFYNEEKEEWHLKDCLVADGLPYHPFCYKDYRISVDSNEETAEGGEPGAPSGAGVDETEDKAPEDAEMPLAEVKQEPEEHNAEHKTVEGEEIPLTEIKKEPEDPQTSEDLKEQRDLKDPGDLKGPEDLKEPGDLKEPEEAKDPEDLREPEAKDSEDSKEPEAKDSEDSKEAAEAKASSEVEEAQVKVEADKETESSEPKTSEEVPHHTPPAGTISSVVQCSIDGNLQLSQAPTAIPVVPKRIKINISKPIVRPSEEPETESDKDTEDEGAGSEPATSEEGHIVLKPKLDGRKLSVLPPKLRGSETSGLCSVM
ncbi:hypothetical protein ONE63_003065 [Megalurothrips usitatus]|uniref:Pcf11 Clp1-ID domain-containing protein n=1 Tax=Megalurothrips usitatus TaxID=439358 RepID=A0AAV7X8N1_9NEOP|nr:hypothetical protein ONE63_003065 [Megalurothrips usitatus]